MSPRPIYSSLRDAPLQSNRETHNENAKSLEIYLSLLDVESNMK